MEITPILTALAPPKPSKGHPKRRHRAARPQLLTRDQLDGRTNAAKVFDRLVCGIELDLGGREHLSMIERTLVEAYAGAYVSLCDLNTRLALGQEIDLGQHSTAVSAMVRVASRLGIRRRARDITSDLSKYLEEQDLEQDDEDPDR